MSKKIRKKLKKSEVKGGDVGECRGVGKKIMEGEGLNDKFVSTIL